MNDTALNREDWLQKAAKELDPLLTEAGGPSVEVHVSIGFPSKSSLSLKRRRIGECWDPSCSNDKKAQIFISPLLNDPVTVLATLLHEQIHASVGTKEGHKGLFRKVAKASGLEGKMTATVPGEKLTAKLVEISGRLGPLPHPNFDPSLKVRKVAKTYLLKVECPECGYTIRVTQKWMDMGLPTCACGSEMAVSA